MTSLRIEPATADSTASTTAATSPVKHLLTSPAVMAVLVWAVATPVAFVLPRIPNFSGAGQRSWAMPITAILLGAAALALIARRRLPEWLGGATAGLFSAWIVFMLATLVRGTPFPMFGLLGDAGRLTAMATRYSVTAASVDAWIPGLAAEYPPLFPWLIGRVSALIDVPAWRMVGDAEVLTTGAAFLLGFLMWQRIMPTWTSLLVTLASFMTFAMPAKSYELATLLVLIPWILATFGKPSRGRLHWLVAGIAGAFIFLTYYGWFIFAAIGVLAIAISQWRAEEDRRSYLLYVLKVAGVTVALSSWFLVPFLHARFTIGSETLGDLYGTGSLFDQLFPFLEFSVLGLLQLIGLVGLLCLRKSVWWAKALLTLVIGAYAYRLITLVLFVLTEHTGLGPYAARLYMATMAAAGVLVLAHVGPKAIGWLSWQPPRGVLAAGLAVAFAWSGVLFTINWIPGPSMGGAYADYTQRAYAEPLPNGGYLVGSGDPEQLTEWFPVTPIQQAVEQVYGPQVRRVSLSIDERLYAYLPWPGYIGNDRNGSFVQWDRRHAELKKLAGLTNPAEFAAESASTDFGPIDIFILRKEDGFWTWTASMGYNQPPTKVRFSPQQFDSAYWVVRDDLPENVVVAIRR